MNNHITHNGNTMTSLIFDTETDGIMGSNGRWTNKQNIIEISWVLFKESTYEIINRKSYVVSDIVTQINPTNPCITMTVDEIRKTGTLWSVVFKEFLDDILKVDKRVIAHNLQFDTTVVMYSSKNIDKKLVNQLWKHIVKHRFCTKEKSRRVCKIPSKYYNGNKYPKMTELYKFVFDKDLDQTHTAEQDTLDLYTIYVEFCKRGLW